MTAESGTPPPPPGNDTVYDHVMLAFPQEKISHYTTDVECMQSQNLYDYKQELCEPACIL